MKICAIIILYNPNITVLVTTIKSLEHQVDTIYMIDNSKDPCYIDYLSSKIIHIKLFKNIGIAAATNIGLKEAIKNKFDFVITSDQDTIYPLDYVRNFEKEVKFNRIDLNKIAAIAPVFYDTVTHKYSKLCKTFFNKKYAKTNVTSILHAIASGLIINMANLKTMGFMDEKLFIDWVDLEWCWRSKKHDLKIICLRNLRIVHALGSISKKNIFHSITLRNNTRYYYITRNAFYLSLHTKYLPSISKLYLFFLALHYILSYSANEHYHNRVLKIELRAFHDGLFGKLGPLSIEG